MKVCHHTGYPFKPNPMCARCNMMAPTESDVNRFFRSCAAIIAIALIASFAVGVAITLAIKELAR